MKKEIDLLEQGTLIVIYLIQLNYVMSFDDDSYVFP